MGIIATAGQDQEVTGASLGLVPRLRSGRLRAHGYAGVLGGWKRILASPMR